MGNWLARTVVVIFGAATLALYGSIAASAQTASPSPRQECTNFSTQEDARRAFDEQGGRTGALKHLDVDGDGQPCEGLPTSGGASPSPAASPAASPTASPGQTLPRNGAGTVAMALSGLTFLEAGYGLTLLAKRLGVRSRALPVYLLQKLVQAAREGRNEVQLGDDVYLVRRPSEPQHMRALPPGPPSATIAHADTAIAAPEPAAIESPPELFLAAEDGVLWIEQPVSDAADEKTEWPFFTPPA